MTTALIIAAYVAAFVGIFVSGFALGGFVATRDEPRDRAPDAHADWLGADAGFSFHQGNK